MIKIGTVIGKSTVTYIMSTSGLNKGVSLKIVHACGHTGGEFVPYITKKGLLKAVSELESIICYDCMVNG